MSNCGSLVKTPNSYLRIILKRLTFPLDAVLVTTVTWMVLTAPTPGATPGLPADVRPFTAFGLHNAFVLGTNVFSGSAPDGDGAFEALAKLGVKTLISVDGAQPDIEAARRHGLRYVHLPHGYDGIATNVQLQLIKTVRTLSGPVYIHCHHGQHRGPTAAAVICMATDGWSAGQAEAWMRTAGTATNYTGLFETVQRFHAPSTADLKRTPADFPEKAKVSGIVEAMVAIDERWAHLKAVRMAGYQTPTANPDIGPANEALILLELLREAQRLPESIGFGRDFVERLHYVESEVWESEKLLRQFANAGTPELRAQLDRRLDAIGQSCASCHATYRDRARSNTGK